MDFHDKILLHYNHMQRQHLVAAKASRHKKLRITYINNQLKENFIQEDLKPENSRGKS